MAERKVKLSIIILNWNTQKLLEDCLSSIFENPVSNLEVIVVDNGSSDGSIKMVKKTFPKVKLIENNQNLGFAQGNNVGIKEANGGYIMLLNSDTVVKYQSLEKLVNFLDENKSFDIVGPKLLNSDGSPQANCGRFPNLLVSLVMLFKEHLGGSNFVRCSPSTSKKVDWLMGSAFVARKKVFEKIGGLDEDLFMYMEEVEWFYQAQKTGFRAYFLKDAEIIHLGRGSSKSGRKEPILNIYRGLIHFYKKHRSLPELIVLELMLKVKALLALLIGVLKNDNYLKETYAQAFKIS